MCIRDRFGTSIPVPDTSVRSVRHPYRYREYRYRTEHTLANLFSTWYLVPGYPITQLAKLNFNHSIGRTHCWRFSFFCKIIRPFLEIDPEIWHACCPYPAVEWGFPFFSRYNTRIDYEYDVVDVFLSFFSEKLKNRRNGSWKIATGVGCLARNDCICVALPTKQKMPYGL